MRIQDSDVQVKSGIDVDITIRQVQILWEMHSERFAVRWKKPQIGNAESVEAAALKLIKSRSQANGAFNGIDLTVWRRRNLQFNTKC